MNAYIQVFEFKDGVGEFSTQSSNMDKSVYVLHRACMCGKLSVLLLLDMAKILYQSWFSSFGTTFRLW